MKSLFILGVLLLFLASATAPGSRLPGVLQTTSSAGAEMSSGRLGPHTAATAVAPGAARDSVEPAERVREPEGAFGFARILLGLLVAAIVGMGVWLGSRYARRRREGGGRRAP